MIKKILITGGAGFIGSHLAEGNIAKGNVVFVLDNLSTGSQENVKALLPHNSFHFIKGDICDRNTLEPLIAQVDIVYHLAAAVGVENIMKNRVSSVLTNITGAMVVFEICSKHHKRVIFTSSSEIYGNNKECYFKEDSPSHLGPVSEFRWSYGCAKMLAEHLALAYHREQGLPVTIARLFNTVGPRQVGKYGMVIPRFVAAALNNASILIYGTGKQTRCFVHIEDVVHALLRLAENEQCVGEIVNLGSSEEISMNDLALKIISLTKSTSKLIHINPQHVLGDDFKEPERRVADISKAEKLIHFTPQKNLQMTLLDIISFFRGKQP